MKKRSKANKFINIRDNNVDRNTENPSKLNLSERKQTNIQTTQIQIFTIYTLHAWLPHQT